MDEEQGKREMRMQNGEGRMMEHCGLRIADFELRKEWKQKPSECGPNLDLKMLGQCCNL